MTDSELLELLESKRWTQEMRMTLVDQWNARRKDVNKISYISIRTPCRLKQIVSSFKRFIESEKVLS
jgi:hypothetical protein